MNKEYKKVYDLVVSLGFSPAYIKYSRGLYSLEVFSLDYNTLGRGKWLKFMCPTLDILKEHLKEVLKGGLNKNGV